MSEYITINLLNQELQINCAHEQKNDLKIAALDLENSMQNIKKRSSTQNREKITILAALEMTYKLNQEKLKSQEKTKNMNSKIQSIENMFEKFSI